MIFYDYLIFCSFFLFYFLFVCVFYLVVVVVVGMHNCFVCLIVDLIILLILA